MEHSRGGTRSDTKKNVSPIEVIELSSSDEESKPVVKVADSEDATRIMSTSHTIIRSSAHKTESIEVATRTEHAKRIKTEFQPTTRMTKPEKVSLSTQSSKRIVKPEPIPLPLPSPSPQVGIKPIRAPQSRAPSPRPPVVAVKEEEKQIDKVTLPKTEVQDVELNVNEEDELDWDWKWFELNLNFDQLNSGGTLDIKRNFIAWANAELKSLVCKDDPVKVSALFSLPNHVLNWQPENVSTFLTAIGFPRTGQLSLEHEVDGTALMLLRMEDVLYEFKLAPQSASRLMAILYRLHQTMNDVLAG